MKLTRFQMAAVKRTAQNVKKLTSTRDKISARILELGAQLEKVQAEIDVWEAPIKALTGGMTSDQVIACNGEMNENEEMEAVPVVESAPAEEPAENHESASVF